MTLLQILQFLRTQFNLQDPEGSSQDPSYLSMSDEDLELVIQMVLTRNFPELKSFDFIPNKSVYSVVLLAKKELYYTLATKDAPLYSLGADNNNYLKRSERFDHYMKLIAQVDKEYSDYLDDGGAGGNTLTSYDVLLPNRYNTSRNYEKSAVPVLSAYTAEVTENSIQLEWEATVDKFFKYEIFVSTESMLDLYSIPPISDKLDPVLVLRDIHNTKCTLKNLEPSTAYYIVVSVQSLTTLKGYCEIEVTTLSS